MTKAPAGAPHRYQDNPDAVGTCLRCNRIAANGAHDATAVAEAEKAREWAHREHQRRYGTND